VRKGGDCETSLSIAVSLLYPISHCNKSNMVLRGVTPQNLNHRDDMVYDDEVISGENKMQQLGVWHVCRRRVGVKKRIIENSIK